MPDPADRTGAVSGSEQATAGHLDESCFCRILVWLEQI